LQEPQAQMAILVRGYGNPSSVGPGVRAAIRALDPQLAIRSMRPLDDVRDRVFGKPRLASWLLGGFGTLALVLMTIGLYGLVAFPTSQQLSELGVRVALGAAPSSIVRLVLRQALGPAALGMVAGIAGAIVLGRLLQGQFYGVEPFDPGLAVGVV